MHLLGLNWQLQETDGYAFENGQVKSASTPTNAVTALSSDGGKGVPVRAAQSVPP